MKIDSKDTDIESLLSGSFFQIPRFQRPYSWDGENINEFWEDLINNQDDDYFIGSMVVYKLNKQKFGVVDGQQRLTTITILLCVIRDCFKDLGETDLAKGLHQLIERPNRDNKNEYVLKTETSFPYFQEYIQKFDLPELDEEIGREEENLKDAHIVFRKLINSVVEAIDTDSSIPNSKKHKQKTDKIISIRDTVLNLNIIFVVLDNEDDAYLIFETLNTRGKDLELTDLVKNHVTKHLKAKGAVDQAKLKWTKVLETIHNSSANISSDRFVHHFWASRYESAPIKKLFPKIKKEITKSKAKGFLNDLSIDSKYYRSIHETSFGWNKSEKEVVSALSALALFQVVQPTPAVLSLVRSYKENKIKLPALLRILKAIEKYHFMFTAVTSSHSSGGVSGMYSSFGRRIYQAKDAQAAAIEIQDFILKLRERKPSLDEFKASFQELHYTSSNSKQKNLVKYVLSNFSKYYSYATPVDVEDLTIEHIAPQSKIGSGEWSEDTIGKIGNLIFIDAKMNSKLKDKGFSDKKSLLMRNKYDLPKFVSNASEWKEKQINEHTTEMAEVAYNKIWNF